MAIPSARATEEPQWTLVFRDGDFEVRDYAPSVVAETEVAGERGAAINEGFRRLARYIFGANQAEREFAMTAPVTQRTTSDPIAMTAPVTQAASGEGWMVTFYMPPGSTLADMPFPDDPRVVLREQERRRVAVLRFSGLPSERNLNRHLENLRSRLESQGEVTVGPITYAFYNPPWTLPWLRRNEVMAVLEPH